jgi:putative ABC transport system ATP-binding protein
MPTLTPTSTTQDAAVAAEAHDAIKVYGRGEQQVHALDGVSVAFERGRFTAIMGPSGSGKSTLMHCVAGLDRLTAGRVVVGGHDLAQLSDQQLTLLRRDALGFVFQAFNLLPALSARENVLLPLTLAGRAPDAAWLDQVVGTLGLRRRLTHRPSELSGGQQQRVALARALVARPQLVFADEPTGNLDSHAGGEILDFLRDAVDELGQTLVMVTHDPLAAAYADRVLFLADGRLVSELSAPTPATVIDRLKEVAS